MSATRGLWLDYEHLRLTVEPHESGWQAFVYDRIAKLIIYRAERMTIHGAKVAAVEFALIHLCTSATHEDPELITESLRWKLIGGAGIQ